MAQTKRRLAGGLLTGLGAGMIEQARAKREMALAQLREEGATKRASMGEDRADARERYRQQEITKRSNARGGSSGARGLLSDKQRIDIAVQRNTTGKGTLEGERTDWDAAAERLRDVGRPDLAQYLESARDSGGIDVDSPEYREASRMAEEWAKERTGLFKSRKAEFPEYGGNRAEATQAKTLELYARLKGGETTAVPRETTPVSRPEGSESASGSGTQEDPYRPTNQAQFDALPQGAIFVNPADGQLYRKQ